MFTTKQRIVMRRWDSINKNRAHMEELILKLMANPTSEPDHLAQAHAMYADVCKRLADVSHHVDNVLRTGSTTPIKIREVECLCKHTFKVIEGETYRCPSCGML